MALRLRKGSDAERLLITPQIGEPIFTTDTKKLYIGDGVTLGGIAVDTGDTGAVSLGDLTDVDFDTFAPDPFNTLIYNGSNWVPTPYINASSLTGNATIDISGSVFGDDSTLIIDGINNTVNAVSVTTDNLTTDRITNPTGSLSVSTDSIVKPNLTVDVVSLDNVSTIALTRTSAADISGDPAIYGRLVFTRNDLNGSFTSSLVSGARDYIALFNDPAGNNADPSKYLLLTNGKLSMGAGSSPSATLEVAGSIKPGVYADATARDAAISSPTAGEMVFVTDVAKFQGYDGSTWANLN